MLPLISIASLVNMKTSKPKFLKNSTSSKFDELLNHLDSKINRDTFHYLNDRFLFHPPNSHFQSLRYELRSCLTFGLNLASITLTNHYMEKFLKASLIMNDVGMMENLESFSEKSKVATNIYSRIDLNDSIKYAFKNGIILKDDKDLLIMFKDAFRNPYSHSDMKKTFKNEETHLNLFSFDDPTKPKARVNMKVSDFIPFQDGRQKDIADEVAFAYFVAVDDICMRYEMRNYPNWKNTQFHKEIDFVKVFDTFNF